MRSRCLIILIVVSLFSSFLAAHIDDIKKCVDNDLKQKIQTTLYEPFYLNYNEPSIEIIQIIDKLEVNALNILHKCISQTYPTSINLISNDHNDKHVGYGNITNLNNILHKVYPNIYNKIMITIEQVLHQIRWDRLLTYPINKQGIRCIRIMEYNTNTPVQTKEEKAEIKRQKRLKATTFIIHPIKPRNKKAEEERIDELSDYYLSDYIRASNHSSYTIYIPLVPRNQYTGGMIIASKKWPQQSSSSTASESVSDVPTTAATNADSSIDPANETEDTAEAAAHTDTSNGTLTDEDDEEEYELFKSSSPPPSTAGHSKKFHSLYTTMQRHTPDQGSAILVSSNILHGIQPILRGTYTALIIELWPYADATADVTHRLSITEAQPYEASENANTYLTSEGMSEIQTEL